jgi:putative transposase
MAYSTNPNLPKARAAAMRLLVEEGLPSSTVARRTGVHRSTIWRWKRAWDELNRQVQLANHGRPNRGTGHTSAFRLAARTWLIPTRSARPHSHPHAISEEIVRQVLAVREQLKRCAEVVWHYCTSKLHLVVSLSSVRRILRRHHCFDGARKKRVKPDNPRRPLPTRPGELVQTDTIHHVDPFSGKRLYIYTVIDLHTRMAYAMLLPRLGAGLAARAVLNAQASFGFAFAMVQSDNGPEYTRFFEQTMQRAGIQTRHSRLHRPNDNAFVERFNRTLQEECLGHYWRRSVPLQRQAAKLAAYLDFYNHERVHLGIQLRTPAEMLQRF